MRTDANLPPQFEAARDQDEKVLWVGKPNFTAFIIRGIMNEQPGTHQATAQRAAA